MHKKSIEASSTLQDNNDNVDDSRSDVSTPQKDKNELQSESIASLRAKAQEHAVKLSLTDTNTYEQSTQERHHATSYVTSNHNLPAPIHSPHHSSSYLQLDPRMSLGYLNGVG